MPGEKCPDRLLRLYKRIYSSNLRIGMLRGIDVLAVLFAAAVFAICSYKTFSVGSVLDGILFLVSAAVPFAIVTVVRRIISAPRPYETFDLSDVIEKAPHYKLGSSFPSRHVFSAFLIGTMALNVAPALGAIILVLGFLLGFARVALGIHFVKDVVCGAIIGIASGVVYILVL
jgi:membrane-associated phospholipid phosphatase